MMGHGFDPAALRGLAEAADLPHLDLRFRECRGRQAPLRGRHRQAPGRRRRPRLFALQRAEPGDSRGPARRLGRCRGRARLLLRHVGDRHPAARLRPARRRRRPFRAALRRDRDFDRPHPRPLRRQLARFPGRRDARRRSPRSIARPRRRAASRSSISKARPTRPTLWSTSRPSRAARDAAFAGERAPADRDRQHLPWPALAQSARATAPTSSVYSLTKYAGGHSDLVAGGIIGSKELINTIRMMRNTIGTITDPNTAWMLLRSLETLELRMTRAGENAAKVCDFLRDHPKVEKRRLSRLSRGGARARPISTAATAPAPARPSRST